MPLTCGVVCGRRPPYQLPLVGGLAVSGTSVMVGPGTGWPWVCHGVPFWVLFLPPPIIDRRLLVLHDALPVDPTSDHGGGVMSCTGDDGMVAQ